MAEKKPKPKAIIVGGSIAGVSTAKALVLAGWDVMVVEKQPAPPTRSPTGAGLALDPLSQKIIQSWLHQPELLNSVTLPLQIEQKRTMDNKQKKASKILAIDENMNFRTTYWADLHGLLYNTLPPEIFLWGHQYLSFCLSQDKTSFKVKAKVLRTDETVEIIGDLLVAADGLRSSIRQCFLPDVKLRYAGYRAWRGVIDFSEMENSETIKGMRKAYPDLVKSLYIDLNPEGHHMVLTELIHKRFNWIWYVNQPEPQLKDYTATIKVSSEMIREMNQEVKAAWNPEFARLVEETREPFINIIYDCDPLTQIFWDKVVLVGDAAHPTTPHYGRSTNMAILDAAVLGKCLHKWGPDNLQSALEEYQFIRVPVTSKQVLSSRRLGRIEQGLSLPVGEPFDVKTASPEDCQVLLHKSVPHFGEVPSILDSMFGST